MGLALADATIQAKKKEPCNSSVVISPEFHDTRCPQSGGILLHEYYTTIENELQAVW